MSDNIHQSHPRSVRAEGKRRRPNYGNNRLGLYRGDKLYLGRTHTLGSFAVPHPRAAESPNIYSGVEDVRNNAKEKSVAEQENRKDILHSGGKENVQQDGFAEAKFVFCQQGKNVKKRQQNHDIQNDKLDVAADYVRKKYRVERHGKGVPQKRPQKGEDQRSRGKDKLSFIGEIFVYFNEHFISRPY